MNFSGVWRTRDGRVLRIVEGAVRRYVSVGLMNWWDENGNAWNTNTPETRAEELDLMERLSEKDARC